MESGGSTTFFELIEPFPLEMYKPLARGWTSSGKIYACRPHNAIYFVCTSPINTANAAGRQGDVHQNRAPANPQRCPFCSSSRSFLARHLQLFKRKDISVDFFPFTQLSGYSNRFPGTATQKAKTCRTSLAAENPILHSRGFQAGFPDNNAGLRQSPRWSSW